MYIVQELYKREIDKIVGLSVILRVDTLTDWVNSTVLSESTNDKGEITKLRVCLDPRDLNKDVFPKQLDSALEGLSGVTGIADDTFTIGSTEQEHEKILANLMEQARQKGIVFNKEKLWQGKEARRSISLDAPEGVRPNSSKVAAIQSMQPPDDVKSLQNFLGLVNYLTRYSAHLANITSLLREFTEKVVAYIWGPEHGLAFSAVKEEVSTFGVLRYFDPAEETVIQTDASMKCLGATILQNGQSVCYASNRAKLLNTGSEH